MKDHPKRKELSELIIKATLADKQKYTITEIIDDIITIFEDDWIPVTDRLPEVGRIKDPKLGWFTINIYDRIDITTLHPDYWQDDSIVPRITHWKPLPKPPKG